MLIAWAWLFAWFLLHEQAGCLVLSVLMFPVIALIGLNILEIILMRKRAFAHMYLADHSWLGLLLTRKFISTIWAVFKALVFTFILFVEASDWSLWIWILLFLDLLLLSAIYGWLGTLLQSQVKPGQIGIISRRILVSFNTIVLSTIIASSQFLTAQPDYRQHSWQETITYSATMSPTGCEAIAPLTRLKSIKDALGWRLAANELSGLQNTAAAILGWLIFLLSSSFALWAFSRLMAGSLIRQTEFMPLILNR
jgi:hypothetical protein